MRRLRGAFIVGTLRRVGASASIGAARPPQAADSRGPTDLDVQILLAEDAAGPFIGSLPEDMMEKAELPGLCYTSVLEALGEKFHAAPSLLKRLNPRARFAAGEEIRVPNVLDAATLARGPVATAGQSDRPTPAEGRAVKVVVSKRTSALTVRDTRDRVILHAPVTSGSEHDPLPIGQWAVTSIVPLPTFNYNPDLFWDADSTHASARIPAGPNNPAGVAWIDIDKPHYGIHGTPEPGTIGYAESHGCVRLTNWDVNKVVGLITRGTPVVFEE